MRNIYIARAKEAPGNLLDELLPWLMQHRVPADDEVRRDLWRCVPEYQPAVAAVLQGLNAPDMRTVK